jgi:hypothetical protein
MSARCDAYMRPFPNPTEIRCTREQGHSDDLHKGEVRDYAYPGSKTVMTWADSDRRTYHGEWPGPCDSAGCILPLGHHGRHAT